MNNDSKNGPEPSPADVEMSPHSSDDAPLEEAAPVVEEASSPPRRDWRHWARYVYDTNPFYLASAALLLFGIARLSTDPTFAGRESAQLIFNFSALEVYEGLLALVALLLARRGIAYDSTLLIVLDALLVFVPFVLITQSVLIGRDVALILAGLGLILAWSRLRIYGRLVPRLGFPSRWWMLGVVLLLANVLTPFLLRHIIDKSSSDAWEPYNLWGWRVGLPGALALANLLPRPTSWGGPAPNRSWLPLLIVGLWIGGTGVHFYGMSYISELPFRFSALVPLMWVLAWTLWNRLTDFVPSPSRDLRTLLLGTPAIFPLLEIFIAPRAVIILGAANALVYAALFHRRRDEDRFRFLLLSVALALGALPDVLGLLGPGNMSTLRMVLLSAGAYGFLAAPWSRHPVMGLCAGFVTTAMTLMLFDRTALPVAMQAGLVVLLVHSLRWPDRELVFASAFRIAAALAWIGHSFVWVWFGGAVAAWTVIGAAVAVLMCHLVARWLFHWPRHWTVMVAAILVGLSSPGRLATEQIKGAPSGLVELLGSFALLALGTAAALLKYRQRKTEPEPYGLDSSGSANSGQSFPQ